MGYHPKSWITYGLDKCVLELKYNVSDSGMYRLFVTRNKQLIEKYHGNSNTNLHEFNNLIMVYDIKNDLFIEINIELVDQIYYPGMPFEMFPEFIINPYFDGAVDFESFYKYQKPIIEELLQRNKELKDKSFENNYIKNDTLSQYNIIRVIYNSLANQYGNITYSFDKKDLDTFITLGEPDYVFYDQQGLEDVNNRYSELNQSLSEFVTYVSACEVMQVPIKELDNSSPEIMNKVTEIWKNKIIEHSQKSLELLQEEEAVLKKENKTEELEEIEFIKGLIKNVINEVDFSSFKTPREISTFWPSLLLPAPPFVVQV